jgi:putative ABC transport system substrate-binding protein
MRYREARDFDAVHGTTLDGGGDSLRRTRDDRVGSSVLAGHDSPAIAEYPCGASLNRPGANVTGIAILSAELAPKRLQLLRELIPTSARFGVLADPASPSTQFFIPDLKAAARTLGLQLIIVNARTDSDLETAFATLSQQRASAVLVGDSPLYATRMEQLAALAARHALPAILPWREYTRASGLMS